MCIEFRGMRRQCSNCYGNHAKKFCKSERVGMANFVVGFRQKYRHVPEELYGRWAISSELTAEREPVPAVTPKAASTPTLMPPNQRARPTAAAAPRPMIKISLKRNGSEWTPTTKTGTESGAGADGFVDSRPTRPVAVNGTRVQASAGQLGVA